MKNACEICGILFEAWGKKKRFCSKSCGNTYTHEKDKKEYECHDCHKMFIRKTKIKEFPLCRQCSLIRGAAKVDRSGSNNPAWRGGYSYWQEGKYGKDKDGLSWSKQKRLVRQRDEYTCKDCGVKTINRKPDIHHIIPFRISRSHAPDNLISLCRKCHKRREALETTLWDGKPFDYRAGRPEYIPKPKCIDCKHKRVLNQEGRCLRCQRKNIDVPLAERLYNEGKTMIEIGKILNVSRIMVFRWLKGNYEYIDKKRGPYKKKREAEVNVPNVLPWPNGKASDCLDKGSVYQ